MNSWPFLSWFLSEVKFLCGMFGDSQWSTLIHVPCRMLSSTNVHRDLTETYWSVICPDTRCTRFGNLSPIQGRANRTRIQNLWLWVNTVSGGRNIDLVLTLCWPKIARVALQILDYKQWNHCSGNPCYRCLPCGVPHRPGEHVNTEYGQIWVLSPQNAWHTWIQIQILKEYEPLAGPLRPMWI